MWRQFMTDLIVGGGEDCAGEGVEGDNGRATVRLGELGLPNQGAAIGSVQIQLVELAGLVLGCEADGSWGGDPCGAGFPQVVEVGAEDGRRLSTRVPSAVTVRTN